MMEWRGILPTDLSKYQGFVYIIQDMLTAKSYIGKKNFWKKIRRKPLKGQKRVRLDRVQSDWKEYNSSNVEIQKLIKESPERFVKTIVQLCKSKEEMAIYETNMQIQFYLNGQWDQLYNEVINLRLRVRKSDKSKNLQSEEKPQEN